MKLSRVQSSNSTQLLTSLCSAIKLKPPQLFFILQLQLADEESRVRAVRRQQFRTLGDHQKMGEDLSKWVKSWRWSPITRSISPVSSIFTHTHTHCTHTHTHTHTLRSMEDTEKLRLKYLRSKRFYKEKVVPYSMSMSTNRRLCRPVYSWSWNS